ncbi:MAG: SMC-Scp complex subunit ScpB [Pseudomonadota bacterium]
MVLVEPEEKPRRAILEPELFPEPPLAEQERMVEAMLFASAEPLSLREMAGRMPPGCRPSEALELVQRRYEGRGVELCRVGDAWAFRTAPDLAGLMQQEIEETRKLSRAATETLAIIAYHQPVTRAEIEEIRGVAVSRGTVDQLIELDWVRFGRRRDTPGRPVTFVVTETFLDHFGLSDVKDLPGLKDLKEAGLLQSRVSIDGEIDPEEDEDQMDLALKPETEEPDESDL